MNLFPPGLGWEIKCPQKSLTFWDLSICIRLICKLCSRRTVFPRKILSRLLVLLSPPQPLDRCLTSRNCWPTCRWGWRFDPPPSTLPPTCSACCNLPSAQFCHFTRFSSAWAWFSSYVFFSGMRTWEVLLASYGGSSSSLVGSQQFSFSSRALDTSFSLYHLIFKFIGSKMVCHQKINSIPICFKPRIVLLWYLCKLMILNRIVFTSGSFSVGHLFVQFQFCHFLKPFSSFYNSKNTLSFTLQYLVWF